MVVLGLQNRDVTRVHFDTRDRGDFLDTKALEVERVLLEHNIKLDDLIKERLNE